MTTTAVSESSSKTFPGGIHPDDAKELARDKPVEPLDPPEKAWLILGQHFGVPSKPVVEKGDTVRKGQKVAVDQQSGPFPPSANLHASIGGKVAAIEDVPHPAFGRPTPAIRIEREDDDDSWAEGCDGEQNIEGLSAEDLLKQIQDAGIVGLGGAGFPTHFKLKPPPSDKIDAVLLNAAECEPYLTCDYRLMLDHPRELIEALRLFMKCVDAPDGYVGIEANKPDAFEAMREAAADFDNVHVDMLEMKYPQGAEHQLIKAMLDREIPWKGGLPSAAGAIVQNVATAYAVYEAVKFRRPLIQRVVTITGDGVERPCNVLARIGAPIGDLLGHAGMVPEARKVILGGPMMGVAQRSLDVPTAKATNGILVLCDSTRWRSRACIRCGECVANCPFGLVPSELSILCEAQDFDGALAANILECKECGCCTYGCPAKRPIVHLVRFAKAELARMKAEAQAARDD